MHWALWILLRNNPNAKADLRQQFLFGLESNLGSEGLWTQFMTMQKPPNCNCHNCSTEPWDVNDLQPLELRISKRQVHLGDQHIIHRQISCDFPLCWKYALTRAHTATLVVFLRAIAKSHFPDGLKSLHMTTLETLRLITTSTLIRHSSQNIQNLLVKLVDNIIEKLHPGDSSSGDASEMTRVLFGVLGTIGDPQSVKYAREVIDRHLTRSPWCDVAHNTRRQVKFLLYRFGT